jgi:hypothetical protein
MQQPCPRCGYVSDRPVRFCRQCGTPLFAENDLTSATTRNYAPNQAPPTNPNQPYTSQYGSGSGLDEQIPETTHFYRPPVAQYSGVPAQKKSNTGLWILIALLSFLLIGGSLAGIVFSFFRAPQKASSPQDELERTLGAQIEKQVEDSIREAQKSIETGEAPPPPPPPPGAPGVMPPDLDKYRYPNAKVEQVVSVVGNEFVKMTTNDNVRKAGDFYQKLIGQPIVKGSEEEGEKFIFQLPGSPQVMVVVSPDDEDNEKTQIIVFRSLIQIPKIN